MQEHYCSAGFYASDSNGVLSSRYDCTLCKEQRVCPTVRDLEASGSISFSGAQYDCKNGYLCPV